MHTTLPPNLEEAWLQVYSSDVDAAISQSVLKEGLRGIALNKEEYFPSLKRLTLWQWSDHVPNPSVYEAEANRALEALYVYYTFDSPYKLLLT